MDEVMFDTLVRGVLSVASRRRVFRWGLGALVASEVGAFLPNAEHAAHARNKKKRRKKKRNRCRLLRRKSSGWCACGGECCLRDRSVCCNDPSDPAGKSCQPAGFVCCPAESGGACAAENGCCPPGFSNDENNGCCAVGSPCCRDDVDCFELVGDPDAVCTRGCCVGP